MKQLPIVSAMLAETRRLGVQNSFDALEAWKAKEAIRLGGDLAHGVSFGEVDQEFIDLMKIHNVAQTSTLIGPLRFYSGKSGHLTYTDIEILVADPDLTAHTYDIHQIADELILPGYLASPFDGMTLEDASKQPIYLDEFNRTVENEAILHKAGVRMGLGTDAAIAGVPFGPSIIAEMELHLQAGVTPLEVMTMATINNAHVMGLDEQLGTVTPGKFADLLLLSADPRDDVLNLAKIDLVFVGGTPVDPDTLNRDTPKDVATRLRTAINGNRSGALHALLDKTAELIDENGKRYRGPQQIINYFEDDMKERRYHYALHTTVDGRRVVQKEDWQEKGVQTVTYDVNEALKVSKIKVRR
ncbi:MAG: amidohydrolase family protein [Pseudomonadota bacterium]